LKKGSNKLIPYILACHLRIDADTDPAYHFDAVPDPDPIFYFDPDPQHLLSAGLFWLVALPWWRWLTPGAETWWPSMARSLATPPSGAKGHISS
jgi:hypothetical protein